MNINQKIKSARQKANLSQNEIAKILNISCSNYQKWEYGERKPKVENLKKIAEACNIDITELL